MRAHIAKQVRLEHEGKTSEDFPGEGHPQTTAANSLFLVVLKSAATPGTPSNLNHPEKLSLMSLMPWRGQLHRAKYDCSKWLGGSTL